MSYPLIVIICSTIILIICMGCHLWGFCQGMKKSEEIWIHALNETHSSNKAILKNMIETYESVIQNLQDMIIQVRPPT